MLNDKKIVERTTAQLLNYNHLISIFKSQELESDEVKTFEYLADNNHPMYLDGTV